MFHSSILNLLKHSPHSWAISKTQKLLHHEREYACVCIYVGVHPRSLLCSFPSKRAILEIYVSVHAVFKWNSVWVLILISIVCICVWLFVSTCVTGARSLSRRSLSALPGWLSAVMCFIDHLSLQF